MQLNHHGKVVRVNIKQKSIAKHGFYSLWQMITCNDSPGLKGLSIPKPHVYIENILLFQQASQKFDNKKDNQALVVHG